MNVILGKAQQGASGSAIITGPTRLNWHPVARAATMSMGYGFEPAAQGQRIPVNVWKGEKG